MGGYENKVPFTGFLLIDNIIDLFPNNLLMDINEIRKWSINEGLTKDPDCQILGVERLKNLQGLFSLEDELQIAITIQRKDDLPFYLEFPYLPIKTLVRRKEEFDISYWKLIPSIFDEDGRVTMYREVEIGFFIKGNTEEFLSITSAKNIVEKMINALLELSKEFEVLENYNGTKAITVNGAFCASFIKEGRYFDINLKKKNANVGCGNAAPAL